MKPKYFMPVHGEYRMLKIHTELAESVGIPAENCFIFDNGEILCFDSWFRKTSGQFHCCWCIRWRKRHRRHRNMWLKASACPLEDGLVVAVLTVDFRNKDLLVDRISCPEDSSICANQAIWFMKRRPSSDKRCFLCWRVWCNLREKIKGYRYECHLNLICMKKQSAVLAIVPAVMVSKTIVELNQKTKKYGLIKNPVPLF